MANKRDTLFEGELLCDMLINSLYNEKDILRSPQQEATKICLNGQPISSKTFWPRNASLRRRNAVSLYGKFHRASDVCESIEIDLNNQTKVSVSRSFSNIEVGNKTRNEVTNQKSLEPWPRIAIEGKERLKESQKIYGEKETVEGFKNTKMDVNHWTDWITEEQVKALTREQIQLQEALWEFIMRESDFLSNLKIILSLFATRLDSLKHLDLLEDIQPQNIFGGIKEIYQSHLSFWEQCPQRCLLEALTNKQLLSEVCLIDSFPIEFEVQFEVYLLHCLFAAKYQEALFNAQKDEAFKDYLKWCQKQECSNRRSLADFLTQPLQHIMRYTLLLKAIASHSSCKENKTKITQHVETIETFLRQINLKVREQEEIEIVQKINQKLNWSSFVECFTPDEKFLSKYLKLDLLAPMPSLPFSMARILLKHSQLKMRDLSSSIILGLKTSIIPHRQETHTRFISVNVYLFTDVLLITKHKKIDSFALLKHPIPLGDIILEKHSQDQLFYLISQSEFNMPKEILCFKTSKPEVTSSWVRAISSASEKFIQAKHQYVNQKHFMQEIVESKVNSLNSPNTISVSSSISSNHRSYSSYELPNADSLELLHEPPYFEIMQNSRISEESLKSSMKIHGSESSHIRIEKMEENIKQTRMTEKSKGDVFKKRFSLRKKRARETPALNRANMESGNAHLHPNVQPVSYFHRFLRKNNSLNS